MLLFAALQAVPLRINLSPISFIATAEADSNTFLILLFDSST
jgi:hypothetical protein